jgi:hypothetical protein
MFPFYVQEPKPALAKLVGVIHHIIVLSPEASIISLLKI